jgi:flagellar P-ring protein precursor FlgI
LSDGKTTTVEKTKIKAEEPPAKMVYLSEGVSIEALVKALNALGVTPRDLIAILQALQTAGVLHAGIEIQ